VKELGGVMTRLRSLLRAIFEHFHFDQQLPG